MKNLKRTLSLLLCLIMMVGLVPTIALAADSDTEISTVVTARVLCFLQDWSKDISNTITCASDGKTEILIIVSRKVNCVSITYS